MGIEPFKFVLRWAITGTIISHETDLTGDPDVERYYKYLEGGLFADRGCPAIERDGLTDRQLQSYHMFYGETELMDGQNFSFYEIPQGAFIDVVRRAYVDPCREQLR